VELYFHSPNTPSWCGAELKEKQYGVVFRMYGVKWIQEFGEEIS
jgi:hypothetical protein